MPADAVPHDAAPADAAPAGDAPFRLLFVCTGNVCRSAMAERLFTAWLADRVGDEGAARVSVSSAGTHALEGHGLPEPAAKLVSEHGGDPEGHRGRLLTPEILSGADLVLVMTRDHRSGAAVMQPSVVQRCFTLREAGRLATYRAGALPDAPLVERFAALVREMAAARGSQTTRTPRADDVIDPFRRSDEVYERCAAQLLPALTAVLDAVAPTR